MDTRTHGLIFDELSPAKNFIMFSRLIRIKNRNNHNAICLNVPITDYNGQKFDNKIKKEEIKKYQEFGINKLKFKVFSLNGKGGGEDFYEEKNLFA